jgi:hypothetical protein
LKIFFPTTPASRPRTIENGVKSAFSMPNLYPRERGDSQAPR